MSAPPSEPCNIAENLQQIQGKIRAFCTQYQQKPDCTQLLAVSKTKPIEDIQRAYTAGQRLFGENYVQEALQKIQQLQSLDIEWHFIGAIQSNKTQEIATHFDWVHSVDRLKIARRLSEQRPSAKPALNICLQINISHETSKSGIDKHEVKALSHDIAQLPGIQLRGLMAIPAKANSLDQQRGIFSQMRQLFVDLQKQHPQMDTLSMGMSGDMEAAIAEGSTLLRIGTAIFGARPPK